MRPRCLPLAVLALALFASPLVASYVIYLKDGSTIVAREKYTVKDGRAIIILPNGTQTFVRASEIDVARTDRVNSDGSVGNTVLLPGDPRPVTQPIDPNKKEKTLKDLIANREAAPRDLPASRRNKEEATPGRVGRTRAGFTDFSTLARTPYPHLEVASALQQFFHEQGFDEVEIHEGTQGDRPLLELSTNSEASVFKALTTAANALIHIRDLYPQRVAAFEILMTTPARERAGQFVLTPQMAEDLVAKRVEVSSFFLQNVQF
ncbi:MAG TPA: hypothetical protein VJ725_32755 [Thermoanaerobaculia bacterium]|nr:hypothetical protein [Thermoanaerobaculia bacterium]